MDEYKMDYAWSGPIEGPYTLHDVSFGYSLATHELVDALRELDEIAALLAAEGVLRQDGEDAVDMLRNYVQRVRLMQHLAARKESE